MIIHVTICQSIIVNHGRCLIRLVLCTIPRILKVTDFFDKSISLLVTRKYEEVQAKLRALKEAAICTKLGHANPPSICFYTILNTKNRSAAMVYNYTLTADLLTIHTAVYVQYQYLMMLHC